MNHPIEVEWWLYILQCGDGTLYVGISTNVEDRLNKHQSGQGAKYTRGRGELKLLHQEKVGTKSAATKREIAIKRMSRQEKLDYISQSNIFDAQKKRFLAESGG